MTRPPSLTLCLSVAALVLIATFSGLVPADQLPPQKHPSLLAGAVVVDVTPQKFPVIVNGSMVSRTADKVKTSLSARGLAISDGETTVVLVVVDSCMMPRPLLDEVKQKASALTGIPADRMLISATHTHSAGSCMGTLGTPPDPNYIPFLKSRLLDTIVAASKSLQPAQIGFASTSAPEFTALRRWIHRPDRIGTDPFGNPTLRANMHTARDLNAVTGESGPEDPELSLISVQTHAGEPLAVLANFSMHYFGGEQGISADYFGLFCDGLKERLAPKSKFVSIMSHGCSGDIWRRDYAKPESWEKLSKIEDYARGLVQKATDTLKGITYRADVDIAMAEQRMTLKYRVPDKQRLGWAQRVVEKMGDRLPKTQEEIYAREQIILHERQETEVVTQALRIGDIAIATTPTETYAITGLKIKAHSPLKNTMVIELANGGDGYIPPPEQHLFGGYNTWAARSAGLEVMAEPRITESCHLLLEKVCKRPRRQPVQSRGPAAEAIAKLKPHSWYRLDEFAGPRALDSSLNQHDGIFESHVTYYLTGPRSDQFCQGGEANRAAMFAGGRLRAHRMDNKGAWSVSLWAWNGMPANAREVTGWILSRGHDHGQTADSIQLGLDEEGHLALQLGSQSDPLSLLPGRSQLARWQWHHVALVCDGKTVRAYLNGKEEMSADLPGESARSLPLFLGGRSDNSSNWEGRLDEVAIFERALSAVEIALLAGIK